LEKLLEEFPQDKGNGPLTQAVANVNDEEPFDENNNDEDEVFTQRRPLGQR
ncbi:unnamed protein product, partial [Rotaria sp. Silwood1]